MAVATERVPVLMTPAEKKRITAKAKKAGITTAEYMRRAAQSYQPTDDNQALLLIIEAMNKATENAEIAIDDAISFVAASNKRILAMEAKAKKSAA